MASLKQKFSFKKLCSALLLVAVQGIFLLPTALAADQLNSGNFKGMLNPASGAGLQYNNTTNFQNSSTLDPFAWDGVLHSNSFQGISRLAGVSQSPQNGSLTINQASPTANPVITLNITASNAAKMFLDGDLDSADSTYGSLVRTWIPYSSTIQARLTGGSGVKHISVKFRNDAGVESPATSSAQIELLLSSGGNPKLFIFDDTTDTIITTPVTDPIIIKDTTKPTGDTGNITSTTIPPQGGGGGSSKPIKQENQTTELHASAAAPVVDNSNKRSALFGVSEDATDPTQTNGLKDTDGDGLSNELEFRYGTNPNLADTDGDGWNDAEEILNLGTDPLVFDSQIKARFTNLKNNQTLADNQPPIRGTAPAGETIRIFTLNNNGQKILLGTATADAESKWMVLPKTQLAEGDYKIMLTNQNGDIILDILQLKIDLNFVLPAPEIFAEEGSIFADNRPLFYGNSYYTSTVVVSFQSLLTSSAVVADNPKGDFSIRPSQDLETGDHTLVAYAELPDGTRSAAKVLHFQVKPGFIAQQTQSHFWLQNHWIQVQKFLILLLILISMNSIIWILTHKNNHTQTPKFT
jgi:hypothetical protein